MEEIIIDGVNVSGCVHCYKVGDKARCRIDEDWNNYCSDNPNCYYKQLKRKEKECEELKGDNDNWEKVALSYSETNYNLWVQLDLALQLIRKTLEQFGLTQYDWQEDQNEITTELQKFVDSKKECEELNKKIFSLKRNIDLQINVANKHLDKRICLGQTLQEIKAIAKERCKDYPNCACKKIVQITSEVEE